MKYSTSIVLLIRAAAKSVSQNCSCLQGYSTFTNSKYACPRSQLLRGHTVLALGNLPISYFEILLLDK